MDNVRAISDIKKYTKDENMSTLLIRVHFKKSLFWRFGSHVFLCNSKKNVNVSCLLLRGLMLV